MLRFFEPELFSAATLDHRTPKQLGFAWESKLSDSRNDAIFPLLPSSSSSSSLLRNNFETNNGARNSSISQGLESLHSYSGGFLMSCEDCDGFQLNRFSSPAPSMNPVPGQASSMASNHAMDMKPGSQTNSKCNEMTGTRKQRKPRNVQTILRERRQKGARDTKPQNPSFDELNQLQRAKGDPKKSQKLGDKITALQQLVSPFGKTDTASVLQEAGICIKVLHEQIRMMSSPYFPVQASPILLGNGGMELGLRERGLCLVPIPSTTEYLSNQEHIGPSVLERMRWEAGIRLPN